MQENAKTHTESFYMNRERPFLEATSFSVCTTTLEMNNDLRTDFLSVSLETPHKFRKGTSNHGLAHREFWNERTSGTTPISHRSMWIIRRLTQSFLGLSQRKGWQKSGLLGQACSHTDVILIKNCASISQTVKGLKQLYMFVLWQC